MIELVLLGVLNGMLSQVGSYLVENKIIPAIEQLHIEGAPSWYGKDRKGDVCASAFAEGDLSALAAAKRESHAVMIERIDQSVKAVVSKTYQELCDATEKSIVDRFRDDPNLPSFVQTEGQFTHQHYQKKEQIAFTRLCIEQAVVVEYQRERLMRIATELVGYQSDQAFGELDETTGSKAGQSGDVFEELERESNF